MEPGGELMAGADVRWGLMATGQIAAVMAEAARPGRFVAAASRSEDRARGFADKCGVARSFGSYEALRAGTDVLCDSRLPWTSPRWLPTSTPPRRLTGCA